MNYSNNLRNKLQEASPFFLYLFLKGKALEAAPENVKIKRKKQENIARYMIESTGISERKFMSGLRIGIEGVYKAQPEKVLSMMIKGQLPGIYGDEKEQKKVFAIIIKIINKIKELFGKGKKIKASLDDAPDFDLDWKGMSPDQEEDVTRALNEKHTDYYNTENIMRRGSGCMLTIIFIFIMTFFIAQTLVKILFF